jgi:arginyl-tRNA synthetase
MLTLTAQLEALFRAAIKDAFNADADPQVGVSQNPSFGDYQANAAMGLAKTLSEREGKKLNPRQIAEQIKAKLKLGEMASEVTIAGPGFINVRLAPHWLASQLEAIAPGERVGVDTVENPQTIVVDYSGPNIAKEMHVGHLRSTIIGDSISRVLEFQGQRVIRQNHIGDWGTQFGKVVLAIWYLVMAERLGRLTILQEVADMLKESVGRKNAEEETQALRQLAIIHQSLLDADPDGKFIFEPALKGLELELGPLESWYQFVSTATSLPAAEAVYITHPTHGKISLADLPRLFTTFIQHPEDPKNEQEKLAWEKSREATLRTCDEIYRELGVKLKPADVRGESAYQADLPGIVADLKAAGVAIESEGAVVVPVPGFDAPLMIQKSDGGYLYGTTDLAAIRYRIGVLGARRIIYTHDSRQQQHFAEVFWTAEKVGWAKGVTLNYAPFGTMLGEDGKPFKTRSGDTVKLKDLLEEAELRALAVVNQKNPELSLERQASIAHAVGIGGIKYSDLSKDRISDYVFSFDKMLALDGNTAPYLQYAHARIRSIFRKAVEEGSASRSGEEVVRGADPTLDPARNRSGEALGGKIVLESPYELALAKHILRLGEVVELVGRELKPHHLCSYLYELATRFSGFYENCPVLQSPEPVRSSRLAICHLAAQTLATGLDLLGIEHPEQM